MREAAWRVFLAALTVGVALVGAGSPISSASAVSAHDTPAALNPSVRSNGTSSLCAVGGGCVSQINGEQPSFNAWNGTSNDTWDFGFGLLVEVAPAGNVVSQSNLLYPLPETTSVVTSGNETNFTSTWEDFVTNSSGSWAPDYQRYTGSPQGTVGLGNVNVTIVFHVLHSGAARWSIKFDFRESGWPWVSTGDHLGLELITHASPHSTPTWYSNNQTLLDLDNSTHAPYAGISFGEHAQAVNPSAALHAGAWVGTYYYPSPLSHPASVILLNFTGSQGGFAGLDYDPYVLFPSAHSTGGGGSPPPGGSAPPPTSSSPPTLLPLVGVGVAGAALLVIAALAVRQRSARPGMQAPNAPHQDTASEAGGHSVAVGTAPAPIAPSKRTDGKDSTDQGLGYVW